MGVPLHRIPFLVQIILFEFMDLPEKFSLATLSKRCRQLLRVIFKRISINLKIIYGTKYTIDVNGEKVELDFITFRSTRSSDTMDRKILKSILVPSRDYGLDAIDAAKAYGNLNQMSVIMMEFLFEVFRIKSILVIGHELDNTAKLLDVIRGFKANHEAPLVKLEFENKIFKPKNLPALHCDEVTFKFDITAIQLIQMASVSKKAAVRSSVIHYLPAAELNKIFKAWMDNSPIEHMELPFQYHRKQEFDMAMQGVEKRYVRIDGQTQNCHVIRQTGGKEAVLYKSDTNQHPYLIYLRTDFEDVVKAN